MFSSSSNSFARCGLLPVSGKAEDFPLLNAHVHYDLVDVQTLANITQTYTSKASSDVEINYVFPLPPDASVCSFKAVIDGKRTIEGVVKEKAKAVAAYEAAVSQGKTAALLSQSNVEIFQVSLGNIRPQQTIAIHIALASIVSHDGAFDSIRLTFPTVIAPRYGIAPNNALDHSANLHRWHYHTSSGFTNALDFSMAIQMTSPIKSISSRSHPIQMNLGRSTPEPSTPEPSADFDPTRARVLLSSPTFLEKDIVIVLTCQGLDKPRCTVESFSPEEGAEEYTDAYALTLAPRFELPSLPSQEYIFVVDRSGSMEGDKIRAVRSALQILLMSLPSRGTFFNIISFGSQHTLLWRSSMPYSANSVKAASTHIDTMDANYGGTEIRAAVEAAFSSRLKTHGGEKLPTSVFVLTDGQAYDLDGVRSSVSDAVAKAKADAGLLRLFCMGIGDAVSKAMCDTMARAGLGTAVFVGEREKPDHKLMGLLRAARGPNVEDISIDWGVPDEDAIDKGDQDFEVISSQDAPPEVPKDVAPISLFNETYFPDKEKTALGPENVIVELPPPSRIQQAPSVDSLPPLYPGFRTSLFAIIKRSGGGNTAPSECVRIKGSVLGQAVVLEVPVVPTKAPEGSVHTNIKMLHVLAARALVQTFEDEGVGSSLPGVQKAKIVRIAERYGIASSETAFVAIDEDGKTVDVVRPVDQVSSDGIETRVYATSMPMSMSSPVKKTSRAVKRSLFSFSSRSAPLSSSPTGSSTLLSSSPTGSSNFDSPAPRAPMGASAWRPSPAPFDSRSKEMVRQPYVGQRPQTILRGGFLPDSAAPAPAPTSVAPPPPPNTLPATIESFARAQSFEGSFTSSPALYRLVVRQATAPKMPVVLGSLDTVKETLWCTLLCVAYLESKFEEEKNVWAFIVEKAMLWVEETLKTSGCTASPTSMLEEAKKCIV